VHRGRTVSAAVAEGFALEEVVDGFRYREGRDLSGYVDGTENPSGEAALVAGFVAGRGEGLDGSSFVAVQRWSHDLTRLEGYDQTERDHIVGRRLRDNEEIDDAPASAHVKRTAQESFEPPAFVLRRSMPYADAEGEGLVFVAFGCSFDAFEALMRRMVGLEDGVVDALFRFTRPVSSSYFWCPPLSDRGLDLSALGL
jgi:putative iron-dependent peroxidase